jgi:hypothetical protein
MRASRRFTTNCKERELSSGIRRTGPPQAVQKIRDGVFMVQVTISESPGADWRRLFYESRQDVTPEFSPRSVEISGTLLRFKTDPSGVEQKTRTIDTWIEKATQKESAMAGRSEAQRQKQEEAAREANEIAAWNARWANL